MSVSASEALVRDVLAGAVSSSYLGIQVSGAEQQAMLPVR
jgi:hypothetical protein